MSDDNLSDWLLTCIEGEGSALRDIIAYVDYRNHAILTYDEFVMAIEHLERAGKVQRQGSLLCFIPGKSIPAGTPPFSRDEFVAAVNEYSSNNQ